MGKDWIIRYVFLYTMMSLQLIHIFKAGEDARWESPRKMESWSLFLGTSGQKILRAREKSLGFSVDKAGELSDRRDLRCT